MISTTRRQNDYICTVLIISFSWYWWCQDSVDINIYIYINDVTNLGHWINLKALWTVLQPENLSRESRWRTIASMVGKKRNACLITPAWFTVAFGFSKNGWTHARDVHEARWAAFFHISRKPKRGTWASMTICSEFIHLCPIFPHAITFLRENSLYSDIQHSKKLGNCKYCHFL